MKSSRRYGELRCGEGVRCGGRRSTYEEQPVWEVPITFREVCSETRRDRHFGGIGNWNWYGGLKGGDCGDDELEWVEVGWRV